MIRLNSVLSASFASALLLASAPASAQTYAQTYAKTGKGGLLLDGMELKRSPKDKVSEAVSMNGYMLIFQSDSNLCVQKVDRSHVWCINDTIGSKYSQIAKVKFEKGTLIAYDAKGGKLWSTRTVADPYAKLILTPQGKLQTTSSVGVVYWEK